MIEIIKSIVIYIVTFLLGIRDVPMEDLGEVFLDPNLGPAMNLLKKWEGFRSRSYRDSKGIWTIGYGTTVYPNGKRVGPNEMISQAKAIEYMNYHIDKEVIPYIEKYVNAPLNNNQYSALVSFVYNVGAGSFRKSSLLKKLNARDYEGAAKEFDKWIKAGGRRLLGLQRRRNDEQALFLQPSEGYVNV